MELPGCGCTEPKRKDTAEKLDGASQGFIDPCYKGWSDSLQNTEKLEAEDKWACWSSSLCSSRKEKGAARETKKNGFQVFC